MKNYLSAVIWWVAGAACFAAGPVYEEAFNDGPTATVELRNGAVLGPAGSGVSGQATDRSYVADLSPEADVAAQPNPVARIKDPVPTPGLEEFTVALWFKAGRFQPPASSLFNMSGLYMIVDDHDGWVLRVETDTAEPLMYWFTTGAEGPVSPWINPGKWVFAACTWTRATGELCFYQGSKGEAAQVAKCKKRTEAVGALMHRMNVKDRPDVVGNTTDPKYARPFNGSIDNVCIYGKALDAAAIEGIRAAHLKNLRSPAF